MTEALAITPRCKVLEVGAGSGYQTAVLARLCARVYAVERIDPLAQRARRTLDELGVRNNAFAARVRDDRAARRSGFSGRIHDRVSFLVLDERDNQFKVHGVFPLKFLLYLRRICRCAAAGRPAARKPEPRLSERGLQKPPVRIRRVTGCDRERPWLWPTSMPTCRCRLPP